MFNGKRASDELNEILNEPEYQVYYEDNRNILEIWWDKVRNWFADLLSNWIDSFEPSQGFADGVLIGVIIFVVVLLLFIVFFVGRTANRKRVFRDQKPLYSASELNWTYKNHIDEAEKQERLNDYRTATRHLFLALLLFFHEKEWLEARIWKTNWEYYDELRKVNQKSADQFYNLALLFDKVTYGQHDVNKNEFLQYKNVVIDWLEKDDMMDTVDQTDRKVE